jgi:hypothetical protein
MLRMASEALNLYLDEGLIAAAHKAADREPIASALTFLQVQTGEVVRHKPAPTRRDKSATQLILRRPTTPEEEMMVWAYRCWLFEDAQAGAAAVQMLFETYYGLTDAPTAADGLKRWVSAVHVADLLRNEPHFARDAAAWHQAAREQLQRLSQQAKRDSVLDRAWLSLAQWIEAQYQHDASAAAAALDQARTIVDSIHPEGYIKPVVDVDDAQRGFQQMLEVTGALCLMAEAAEHAGGSLWAYQNRGVGISTAVAYVVSFYFYPEKWRWGGALDAAFVTDQLNQHGAFLEMAARRAPLRATDILLEDLRPMFSLYFGGLTTFTHGAPPEPEPKKRRFLW